MSRDSRYEGLDSLIHAPSKPSTIVQPWKGRS
jgi:hypothetical protein